MNTPLVSIAVCTFNGRDFLAEQLDSLINQSYTNIEIVIIDDCSSDGTQEILSRYRILPEITVYLNSSRLGYSRNFELAISKCKGDFIALCDQDDIWANTKIQEMVERIGDSTLIYHNSLFVNMKGESLGILLTDKVKFIKGSCPESFLLYNYIPGHTMLFKRDLLRLAMPFPEGIYHDWWLAFVASYVGTLNFIETPLVKYRIHTSNHSDVLTSIGKNKSSVKKIREFKKMIRTERILKVFLNAPELPFNLRKKIANLLHIEQKRIRSCFSFSLFFFLLKNLNIYASARRNWVGKINAVRKDCRGSYIIKD